MHDVETIMTDLAKSRIYGGRNGGGLVIFFFYLKIDIIGSLSSFSIVVVVFLSLTRRPRMPQSPATTLNSIPEDLDICKILHVIEGNRFLEVVNQLGTVS